MHGEPPRKLRRQLGAYGYAPADAGRRGHIGIDHSDRRPTRRHETLTLLINVSLRRRVLQLSSRGRST